MSGFATFIAWALTVLIATFVVYWLWNAVLVRAIAFIRPITFWDALGISILTRLLFGPNLISEDIILQSVPKELQATTVQVLGGDRSRAKSRSVKRT